MKILDSSYILHAKLDFSKSQYCLTNSVLEEIKSLKARLMIDSEIKKGNIKVSDPSLESIRKVKKVAKESGDLDELSRADLEILALALEKKERILTDDYAIQNVASLLNLPFEGQKKGIKKKLKWEKICIGCGEKYSSGKVCLKCGAKLRRKVSRLLK